VVGHPAAVNPDARLARIARSYEWPILHTSGDPARRTSERG
jgi:phosphoserine phosphatase